MMSVNNNTSCPEGQIVLFTHDEYTWIQSVDIRIQIEVNHKLVSFSNFQYLSKNYPQFISITYH